MTEAEYQKVACRGIATGCLVAIDFPLEQFRINAELAGLQVNHRVFRIKKMLQEFAEEITSDSWADKRELD